MLRCFNPVGAHPSGSINDGGYGNVVSHICRVAAGKIDKLLIFGDEHDTIDGTRTFLLVKAWETTSDIEQFAV